MKRPISILCMADLHCENGNMKAIDQLHKDYKEFVDQKVDNQRWNPDYIVVAGDVIDWTSQYNPDKYDYAKKSIDGLIEDFGIAPKHVIIVPGNHDNMISTDVKIKDLDQDRSIFEKFCNDEKGAVLQDFKNTFLPRFEDYLDFCTQYMDSTEYFNQSLLAKELQCLAGVRVFEEDHLCFVVVNTEWLYIPKDPFEKHIDAYVSDAISSHMKLYEKCQLCTPLIKDAYELIRDKYANYTIVTVMHRGFEDLTWKENNASDKLNIDAIKYLKSVSDIILTGHDHTIRTEPPTLINNRIQHFRLGSVGRKEPKTREYIRTASIIRFSPIEGDIELLHMEYEGRNKTEWSFTPHQKVYPLFSKYEKVEIGISRHNHDKENITIIRSRKGSTEDVEDSIQRYYQKLPDNFVILHAKSIINNGLDNCFSVNGGFPCFIIVYYMYNEDLFRKIEGNNIIIETRKKIMDFKKQHLMDFLLNNVIISEVIVETPVYDILEKNV